MTKITKKDLDEAVRKHMSKLGKKGGAVTNERYGSEHFANIAKSKKGTKYKRSVKKGKAKGLQSSTQGANIAVPDTGNKQ